MLSLLWTAVIMWLLLGGTGFAKEVKEHPLIRPFPGSVPTKNKRIELVKMTPAPISTKQQPVVQPAKEAPVVKRLNAPGSTAVAPTIEGVWEMAANKRLKKGSITFNGNGTYLMKELLRDDVGVSKKGEYKVNYQTSPSRIDICLNKCGVPGSEWTTSFGIFRFLPGNKLEIRSSPDGKYPACFNDGQPDEYTMILTRTK